MRYNNVLLKVIIVFLIILSTISRTDIPDARMGAQNVCYYLICTLNLQDNITLYKIF